MSATRPPLGVTCVPSGRSEAADLANEVANVEVK